jgi:pimeloyl-ACP methyl ester carboxylesterase
MKIFKLVKRIFIGVIILSISLVIIGFAFERISRFNSNNKYHPDGEYADLGDHKLHFVKKGKGSPTVIFESGLDPGGHLPWFKVQKEISRYTTTISYDRAGVLWSDRGNGPKTGKAIAKELFDLLEKTNCPKPYIVVGHSLAGLFLRNFIAENKTDISGVIFVDVSHPEQNIRRPKSLESLSKFPSTNLIKFANAIGLLRLFYSNTYPNTSKNDSINLIVRTLFNKGISTYIEEQNAIGHLLEESKKIDSFDSIPLKVITGISQDKYLDIKDQKLRNEFLEFKISLQKDLLNLSKNSELIIAPKSGHYVQLEQPDIVINTIKKMLEKKSVKKK